MTTVDHPAAATRTAALASWILTALVEELAVCSAPVDVTLIAPGARPPPADWVCITGDEDDPEKPPAEGMAWARIGRRYPTENFPGTATRGTCSTALAAEFEIGVYRCAHTLDDQGHAPDPLDVTADAMQIDLDAFAFHAAIKRLKWPYVLGAYTALGPSGGVVGGAQLFTVLLSQGPIGRERTS